MKIDKNFDISYEDKDLLIINKSSNLCVCPGINNESNTLLDIILFNYPELKNLQNNGIVHRLDKNTTGLLIISKNENSYFELKKYFFLKKIIKKYIAVITGELISGGTINKFIYRHSKIRNKMYTNNKFGKKSITHYFIKKKLYLHTYIKIILETGKTHQIRSHMSYMNHSIVGDLKYKNNSSNYKKSLFFLKKNNIIFNRQALHAYKLIFKHPISKKILNIKSKIPDDINNLINSIELNS